MTETRERERERERVLIYLRKVFAYAVNGVDVVEHVENEHQIQALDYVHDYLFGAVFPHVNAFV